VLNKLLQVLLLQGLSVVEKAKIITLHEEEYSEKQISEDLKFSKTAILQDSNPSVVRFKEFGSFQHLHRAGRPKVTSQRHDKEDGSVLTHDYEQKDLISFVAYRYRCQHV